MDIADDQSVAGGIVAGMTPLETMIKECEEEASLPEELVRKHVRSVLPRQTVLSKKV